MKGLILGAALIAAVIAAVIWTGEPVPPDDTAPVVQTEPAAPSVTPADAAMAYAVPLVAKWEGLRTEAYRDPVGVLTVCYGETEGVQPGDSYTADECAAMLARRLHDYRDGVRRYFTDDTKANRLPPTRDAAFTSFAYNVGIAGAGGSTATKRLNAGNVTGACEALGWWNKAGGRVLRGLVNRRADETALCLRGTA